MATVSVHNPHHSEGLLRQANRLRLAGTLCDVVISVERQEYRAHSLVLACASRTLEEMFRSQSGRYSLDFLGSQIFERILEYAYTERLEVRPEELGELRHAATLLAMDGLEELILEVTSRLEDEAPAGNPRQDPTLPVSEGTPRPGIQAPGSPPFLLPRAGSTQPRGTVITGPGYRRGAKGPRQPTPVRPLASLPPPPPGTVPLQAPSGLRPTPLPVQPLSPAYPRPLEPGSYPGAGAPGTPTPDGGARNSQQIGGIGLAFRGNSAVSEGPVRVESSTDPQRSQMETVTLLPCEFCGKRFLDSFHLRLHLQSHLDSSVIVCNQCGLRMNTHEEAMLHRQRHSGGLSMPVYLLCGKGLEMPLGVTPHAPGQGGASWRYSCRECERLFPSLTALKRHLRSHVGEKPFECKLCHQRSRDYSAMIKHLRTHNGALPYRCTVCQEYCSSLAVMQKHIKTHLPEEVPPDWSLEESYLYLCYL